MRYKLTGIIIVFFIFLLLMITGNGILLQKAEEKARLESENSQKNYEAIKPKDVIEEKFEIIDEEYDYELHHIYINVYPSDGIKSVDFSKVNETLGREITYLEDQEDPYTNIYFSNDINNESEMINGTIEIRGQSSRNFKQKSYKIKLDNKTDSWFGFKTLNLNKHYDDALRIRNKLSFDLFKSMKNMYSLETKFVELHVRDMSLNNEAFISYGLYTFIEQPNGDFLKRAFDDKFGIMYKAEYFEYLESEDLQLETSLLYDANKFENHLEVKGVPNHEGLLKMIEDVNNYNIDINEIIDTYFHEENMLTWLAFNILTTNYDSNSRNYIIYSPLNSTRWYYLPWDYDKAWELELEAGKWERGLSNYWGVLLFNRYLKGDGNIDKVIDKVNEIHSFLNSSKLEKYIENYKKTSLHFMFNMPDSEFIYQEYPEVVEDMKHLIILSDENFDYFIKHLEDPMPFHYNVPVIDENNISFEWEPAFDLQQDVIRYDMQIAKDPGFSTIVFSETGIVATGINIGRLESGTYYFKVTAKDQKGNYQEAFDYYVDDVIFYGIQQFIVE